jgi:signal transduction histidine kinase
VAEARARAAERLRRQRGTFRPLGIAIIIAVVAGSASTTPHPALHGQGLGVTLSLLVYCGALLFAIRDAFAELAMEIQAVVIAVLGASGIALLALQPKAASGVAGAAAVWMAVARLPWTNALAIGGATTVGLGIATALAAKSGAAVLATVLLCALLGLVAHFIRQSRDGQEQTEILLAQLKDAQEEQARAAAIAERGRIASELHDVLAHSLSGAAIQLQGARKLAERSDASADVRQALDRAAELVRAGLEDAREAVGALRGDALPGVGQLDALVESFRADMGVDVSLTVAGSARTLPSDAGLALYRGTQEALTNVARYAPGASAAVLLEYEPGRTTLRVENAAPTASVGGLAGVGGGRGLAGMRERMERAGGTMDAGPVDGGWRVQLEVPA